MSTQSKGRVCCLNPWEVDERERGSKPNCRNHRHISKTAAFDLSGRPHFGRILAELSFEPKGGGRAEPCGYLVKVAGRIEFTITNQDYDIPFDQVRSKGLELEKKLGVPFIERKVPLRTW